MPRAMRCCPSIGKSRSLSIPSTSARAVTLVEAMNSHDVGRDRGGVEDALARVTARALVLGIDSDRLFPIDGQHRIARGIPNALDGDRAVVLTSDFGHDGFLIETHAVGTHLRRLLAA